MPATLPILDLDPQAKLADLLPNEDFTNRLAQVLSAYLPKQRWFTSKGKDIAAVEITHAFVLTDQTGLLVLTATFKDSSQEMYQLPLAWNWEPEWIADLQDFNHHIAIAQIGDPAQVILSDAINRASFRSALFRLVADERLQDPVLTNDRGKLIKNIDTENVESVVPALDTSNTAIIYQDQIFFKLFRKLDQGLNPDLELVRFISEHTSFKHSPTYGGSLSLGHMHNDDYVNLGIGIGKVDNLGDAWGLFQDLTEGFYRRVLDQNLQSVSDIPESRVFDQLSQQAQQLIGHETARRVTLLAKRTGEMHLALASANESRPELVPEALTSEYRHEIGQAAESLFDRQITQLKDQLEMLKPEQQALAQEVIEQESIIRQRLSKLADRDLEAKIIRIHGDYHLGQVLYDESDYCIIDFEGEPLLSIPERRRKRPAYKDVAGMIRSLHYAVSGQLLLNFSYRTAQVQELKPWGNWWFRCLRTTFLHTYNNTVEQAGLLPTSAEDRELLLDLFILEKAIYEVAYELNCRLHWLDIPLQGLLFALEDAQ